MTFTLLLLSTILPWAAPAFAGPVYDDINGSCEDFNDVIKTRGLKDPAGNSHPGTLGWTLCQFKASSNGTQVPVTRSTKDGRPCLSIEMGKVELTADVTVVVARWSTDLSHARDSCRKELARIDSDIRAHESHHVDDCKTIINEEKAAWAEHAHIVIVCDNGSKTEAAMLATLQSKAGDELHAILNHMNHEMEYRSKETHEKIGYGTLGIRCGECSN